MRFLLDTSTAIHFLGGTLLEPLPEGEFALSVISEIELLSFPGISAGDETAIRQFIQRVYRLPLNDDIRDQAVSLRRSLRLKLPDAVIAATAIVWDGVLLTHDGVLLNLTGLEARALPLSR